MIGHTKVSGPLAVLADGFRTELDRLGYTPSSREYKLAEVARLSAWLQARGLGARDICPARLGEFFADLAAQSRRAPTLVAMRPLLAWLGEQGLCGDDPAPTPSPLDAFMGRYRRWLATDRQLAPRTISRYEQGARLFLGSRARQGGGPAGVGGLREELSSTSASPRNPGNHGARQLSRTAGTANASPANPPSAMSDLHPWRSVFTGRYGRIRPPGGRIRLGTARYARSAPGPAWRPDPRICPGRIG